MTKKYEHRPGLFGLATIAAGCAAREREDSTKEKSMVAGGSQSNATESRSRPMQKQRNHSGDDGSGAGV
jgi:hypothetical protein